MVLARDGAQSHLPTGQTSSGRPLQRFLRRNTAVASIGLSHHPSRNHLSRTPLRRSGGGLHRRRSPVPSHHLQHAGWSRGRVHTLRDRRDDRGRWTGPDLRGDSGRACCSGPGIETISTRSTLDGFSRNRWTAWPGTGGRVRSESTDPSGTGPPTRIRKSSPDRSSTTSMPRRLVGRKLSSGLLSERSRTSRRDSPSSCPTEERWVNVPEAKLRASPGGRTDGCIDRCSALSPGVRMNGRQGPAIGVWGARVGGRLEDRLRRFGSRLSPRVEVGLATTISHVSKSVAPLLPTVLCRSKRSFYTVRFQRTHTIPRHAEPLHNGHPYPCRAPPMTLNSNGSSRQS